MQTITSQSAILHLLLHRPQNIKRLSLFVSQEKMSARLREICQKAKEKNIPLDFQSPNKTLEGGEYQEPIEASVLPFAFTDLKTFLTEQQSKSHSVVLALDHLQDPQNFGALARTAEALGVAGIVLPKDRSVTVTPGVYNASVGAVETIPVIQIANLGDALRKLKDCGFWIVGTCIGGKATSFKKIPLLEKSVLVLGTELEGISPHILSQCDFLVEIALTGKVQSLNVSAAGAILLYELTQISRTALIKK